MNVLVTGSANGIGKAVCEYLINKEINVYAIDIKETKIDKVNNYIVDVTNINQLQSLYNKFKNDNIMFDAIINIAGIFIIDSFIEVNEESLKKIFDVNLFGAINVNKVFLSLLKEKGRIIITSSEVAPLDPLPFNGIYSVTKTAVDSYAQALRQELNLLGYKVITVRPGAFNTNLSNGSLVQTKELMERTELYNKQSKKFYDLVRKFMGTPKDVSKVVKTYYKALIKKKPKIIYKKNTNKLLKLMSILPKRMQCFIIKKLLK